MLPDGAGIAYDGHRISGGFSLANATDTRDFGGLAAGLTASTFQEGEIVPPLTWKRAPLAGHVTGFATLDDGTLLGYCDNALDRSAHEHRPDD